jgi:hypothetical protein
MPTQRLGRVVLFAGLVVAAPVAAQQPSGINFSGVVYANYQYRTDPAQKNFNRFDLERTYLTFRMPAGDRAGIRVTTDVFQQQNAANASYYGGWVIRMKYAYLQYDYARTATWSANARIGLLHTVIIDHQEQFFPRWISQVATERAGYFSSADAGLATTITLPKTWGEIYGTITNGPGYGNRETDRFKDFAVRLSLTPLARGDAALFKTFTVSPWYSKGAIASRITGVTEGLARDRYGVFVGLRDPRLTAGAEIAGTSETGESGTALNRTVADSSGRLASGFVWAKPWASDSASLIRKLGFLARYDQITPRTDVPTSPLWPAKYHIFIGGLTWDLTNRAALSFDYQEQLPVSGGIAPVSKTFFAHFVANF